MSNAFPLWLRATAAAGIGAVVAWRWLSPPDRSAPEGQAAASIRAEWEGISKTPGGRVDRTSFKAHCLKKHAAKLTPVSSEAYIVRPGSRTSSRPPRSRSTEQPPEPPRHPVALQLRHLAATPARTSPRTPPPTPPPLSAQVFLDRLFDTGTGLMLKPNVAEKADLGRHCFSYCNLLAGEFYFQQAAEAQPDGSAMCGCGTPVADVLQLVPPK